MARQFLRHKPKTEEQVMGIIPKGKHKCIIQQIDVVASKKNPDVSYFVAIVEVHCAGQEAKEIKQWLALDYLLKHLYDACGKSDVYNNDQLCNEDCEGHVVYAEVDIQEPTKDFNRPKNVITDFYAFDKKSDDFNDDITF